MDISEMMVGTGDKNTARDDSIAPPTDLDNIPSPAEEQPVKESSAAEPGVAELSAVERIRAYRNGTLTPPALTAAAASEDEQGEGDGESVGDQDHDHDQPEAGGEDTDAHETSVPPAAEFPSGPRRRVPRKALLIGVPAVALIAVGVAAPGMGGGSSEPAVPAVISQQAGVQTETETTAIAGPVNIDTVITPVSVEGPEYPISLTPPMEAFSGQEGKGWISGGLDGTVLTITLPEPTVITEISVIPGLLGADKDGSELWAKHRIVTSVAYNLDYGDPIYGEYTATKRERQVTEIPSVITKTIRMVILGTEDVSGQVPAASAESQKPGLLGDLGSLRLGGSAPAGPKDTRPATFAIGSIEITGHSPV